MYELKNLGNLEALGRMAPAAMSGFKALDEAALAEGAVPRKYKELMAVAVALTTQCPYCIEVHRKAAVTAGASETELAETAFVAVALRAGGALTHATHLIAR